MKIWLDDPRPAPEGYIWCHSVNEVKRTILAANEPVELRNWRRCQRKNISAM